jgi:NAD-dependent DNA ligase
MLEEEFYRTVNDDRVSSRHIDELLGLARGLCADNILNALELEVLQNWVANHLSANDQPLMQTLYTRIAEILADGLVDQDEHSEIFEFLKGLGGEPVELGEVLKPSTLPLCCPPPKVQFQGRSFAFTGTFAFGQRKACEKAVADLGGSAGSLTKSTDYLVIGCYVTESWKHSSMGNKILKAVKMRSDGVKLSIISEDHWKRFL